MRFSHVFSVKMLDQSFFLSTALAEGCGVAIGWIVRGIFHPRAESNSLASQMSSSA